MTDASQTFRRWVTFAGCVLVVVVLDRAQTVLVPLALAILLTFILTPPVVWLRASSRSSAGGDCCCVRSLHLHWTGRLGPVPAVEYLADDLPRYRVNILAKIADVRGAGKGGSVEKLQETLDDIKSGLEDPENPKAAVSQPIVVTSEPVAGIAGFAWLGPLVGRSGTAGLVMTMAIFTAARAPGSARQADWPHRLRPARGHDPRVR